MLEPKLIVTDVDTQTEALHPEALLFSKGQEIVVSDGTTCKIRKILDIRKFSPRGKFFATLNDQPLTGSKVRTLLSNARITAGLAVHLREEYPNFGVIILE